MAKYVIFLLCATCLIVLSAPGSGNQREKRASQNNWPTYLHNTTPNITRIKNRQRRQSWGSAPSPNWNNADQTNGITPSNQNFYDKTDQNLQTPAPVANNFNGGLFSRSGRQSQSYYDSTTSYDRKPPPPPPSDDRPGYNDFHSHYENRPPPPPPRYDSYQSHFDRGPPPRYDDRRHDDDDRPPPPPRNYEGKPPHDRGPPPHHYGPPPHDRKPPPPPPPPPDRGPPPHDRLHNHFDRRSTAYENDDHWGHRRDHDFPPPRDREPPPGHYGGPPHDRGSPPDHHGVPPPHDRAPPPRDKGPPPHDRGPPPDHFGRPPPNDRGPPPEHYGRPPPPPPPYDRRSSQYSTRPVSSHYYDNGPSNRREPDLSLVRRPFDRDTSSYYDKRLSPPSSDRGQESRSFTDSTGPLYEKLSILSDDIDSQSKSSSIFDERLSTLPRVSLDIRSVTEKEFDIDTRLGFHGTTQGSFKSRFPPVFQVIPVRPES